MIARGRYTSQMTIRAFAILAALSGCGSKGVGAADLSCKTDADCRLSGMIPGDCCGDLCGEAHIYNAKWLESVREAHNQECEAKRCDKQATCSFPSTTPVARCQANSCVIEQVPRSSAPATAPKTEPAARSDLSWPTIDGAKFLTVAELATACGVKPAALSIKLAPAAEPTRDAVGEDRTVYVSEVSRASENESFMGIVVQARETAEQALKVRGLFASLYKPVAGSTLLTHRIAGRGWVRREIHGLKGRLMFSAFETDAEKELVICDDAELLALARLMESRLP